MTLEKNEVPKVSSIAENVTQNAVNETGFGRFNLKIMAVCALIYMNGGFGMSSLSLIMPLAACDFDMTTVDKGRLSVASSLGMVSGAYIWACAAEMKGRKFGLIASLFLHGVFDAISAVSPNYWLFVSTKFFSGLGMSGQLALIFAYLGEFQPTYVRDRIMSWMELAWVVGLVLVPLIGWAIIPLDFEYRTANFLFHSWNLFMLICSAPAILVGIWLMFLPETPKYLAESGQYAELLKVLESMYSVNNGLPNEAYVEKISKIGDTRLDEMINLARMGEAGRRRTRTLREMALSFFGQTVMILKPPYLTRTLLICTVITCLMSTYFPLSIWFPEIFNRFSVFETLHPEEATSICGVSANSHFNQTSSLTPDSGSTNSSSLVCDIGIKDDVYLHTVILGLGCVPAALWLPLFVERLGYVFHLVLGSFICAAVTLGLFFVTSSVQNLILACVFESVASICITAVLCMVVELYPTNLRVMAAAFSMFIGRVGTFTGNAFFGYLIDDYCVPLFIVLTGQLIVSGVLSLFIPRGGYAKTATADGSIAPVGNN